MLSKKQIDTLFLFGRLFSPFYALAMYIRAWLYKTGIKTSLKVEIPVISVGNLTMGGTGKTPMVIYIAQLLKQYGRHPAIISRGYGGKSKKSINIVSDGRKILLNAAEAGDEPVLLAKTLKIPILTGRKRIITSQYILKNKMADTIIMDDGFQHLALQRDLNIALFSGEELLGNGHVFPGGILREPRQALQRANCFVITGVTPNNSAKVADFSRQLQKWYPAIPQFKGEYIAIRIINNSGEAHSITTISEIPLLAFCGIAKPQSFFNLIQSTSNLQINAKHSFTDHHPFRQSDLTKLEKEAHNAGCKALLTTEKDMVKLKLLQATMPIWALQIKLSLNSDFDDFVIQKISPQTF